MVPVLCAGASPPAAVAESLLHDLGDRGGFLAVEVYRNRVLSRLLTARDLNLVRLHNDGLIKVGVQPFQLTDTDASHYPRTVRWARAAHRLERIDGLVWMSWRWSTDKALVLFGDREGPSTVSADDGPLHVFETSGSFAWLSRFCERLGITVTPPGGESAFAAAFRDLLTPTDPP